MIKDQSETVEHVATLTFLSRIWSGLFVFIPVKSRAAIFFLSAHVYLSVVKLRVMQKQVILFTVSCYDPLNPFSLC